MHRPQEERRKPVNLNLSFARAETEDHLVELYDKIYAHDQRAYGSLGPYACLNEDRLNRILEHVRKNVEPGASILEVGCGRGYLLRKLLDAGYRAQGTEISHWLIEHDLQDLPVLFLSYGRLGELPDKSFDCVLSSDVLEHLLNQTAVGDALSHMARLSRQHVLVSVGMSGVTQFSRLVGVVDKLPRGNLHCVRAPAEWWTGEFERHCVVDYGEHVERTLYLFGRVRPPHPTV